MELNEMKNIWKGQEVNSSDKLSKEQLIMILNNKMISFEERVQRRDWLEITVAVLIAVGCGVFLFFAESVWHQLGCVTLILASGLIIYKLRSAQRDHNSQSHSADRSFREHLDDEIGKLKKQKKLLKSMLWWYLFPIFLGILFFVIGFNQQVLVKAIYLTGVIILYAYIWKMNQDAVSKYIDPMLADIQNALTYIQNKNE